MINVSRLYLGKSALKYLCSINSQNFPLQAQSLGFLYAEFISHPQLR